MRIWKGREEYLLVHLCLAVDASGHVTLLLIIIIIINTTPHTHTLAVGVV